MRTRSSSELHARRHAPECGAPPSNPSRHAHIHEDDLRRLPLRDHAVKTSIAARPSRFHDDLQVRLGVDEHAQPPRTRRWSSTSITRIGWVVCGAEEQKSTYFNPVTG